MSVLSKVEHARIIADKERVCATAGLQPKFLDQSMTEFCGMDEVGWVRRFWENNEAGLGGLVLAGVERPDTRCQAICAALVRNFIDARVMPLNTVLELHDSGGDVTAPRVILIPNLYVTAMGKSMPAWKVQILYDLLLARSVQNRPSVLYVESMSGMIGAYGQPFADFLGGYKIVSK